MSVAVADIAIDDIVRSRCCRVDDKLLRLAASFCDWMTIRSFFTRIHSHDLHWSIFLRRPSDAIEDRGHGRVAKPADQSGWFVAKFSINQLVVVFDVGTQRHYFNGVKQVRYNCDEDKWEHRVGNQPPFSTTGLTRPTSSRTARKPTPSGGQSGGQTPARVGGGHVGGNSTEGSQADATAGPSGRPVGASSQFIISSPLRFAVADRRSVACRRPCPGNGRRTPSVGRGHKRRTPICVDR